MKKLLVFALFVLVSVVVAEEDKIEKDCNGTISFLVKEGANDENSPLSAILCFYSISKEDTLTILGEMHDYAFSQGSDSPYFKKLSAVDDRIISRLCKLYDGCLTGMVLRRLKKGLKNFGSSFLYTGNLSPYVYPPAKLIGKEIVKNDGQTAEISLIFKGTGKVVIGLERTSAGWRINKIQGDYCNVGN